MPFGLKIVWATYQRVMNTIFCEYIGKFMEIYIDDVVIKSNIENTYLDNLRLSFEKMHRHNLKINSLKCAFGLFIGNFLGFLIRKKRIEVDKNKTRFTNLP